MLTLCASCGMIQNVEGQQGFVSYSPPESGVPMSLVPSTSTSADSIGTPDFVFIANLTGATNTRKVLTRNALWRDYEGGPVVPARYRNGREGVDRGRRL